MAMLNNQMVTAINHRMRVGQLTVFEIGYTRAPPRSGKSPF